MRTKSLVRLFHWFKGFWNGMSTLQVSTTVAEQVCFINLKAFIHYIWCKIWQIKIKKCSAAGMTSYITSVLYWCWFKWTQTQSFTVIPRSVVYLASCSKSGTFLRIHLWIFPVFTPSSPKWSVQMCRGSRTGAAISVHTSAALMMMPLDLLCSAIWALDPIWLRKAGIPRHAFLSWSGYVYTAGISCIQAHGVLIFCFSASDRTALIFSLHYTRPQQVPVAEPPSDRVMDADNHNAAELQHVIV